MFTDSLVNPQLLTTMFKLFGFRPGRVPLRPRSRVYDLKDRLDWGEPALTIIDVRDRGLFHHSHIVGAILIPVRELVNRCLLNFELARDIYVYGETDEETAEAAMLLRTAGFQNVSELQGGLAAWKAVGFPIETSVALPRR